MRSASLGDHIKTKVKEMYAQSPKHACTTKPAYTRTSSKAGQIKEEKDQAKYISIPVWTLDRARAEGKKNRTAAACCQSSRIPVACCLVLSVYKPATTCYCVYTVDYILCWDDQRSTTLNNSDHARALCRTGNRQIFDTEAVCWSCLHRPHRNTSNVI